MKYSIFVCPMIGILACSMAACSAGEGQDFDEAATEQQTQPLYYLSNATWADGSVPVCWENPEAGTAATRQVVYDAIHESWARYADIRFSGFGRCSDGFRGVRIRIEDVRPAVFGGLGTNMDLMKLNFLYRNWSSSCQSDRRNCIWKHAIHEFGHALSFAHEQNRDDATTCTDQRTGSKGDRTVGRYDTDSVMNYCGNYRLQLSPGDIFGVQYIYGRKPSGSIVSYGGKCLSTLSGNIAVNEPLHRVTCLGREDQQWNVNRSTGRFHPRKASAAALAIAGASLTAGARAEMDVAALTPALRFSDFEIRGPGGRCLTLLNGAISERTPVVLATCSGAEHQRWNFTTSGELVGDGNLCLRPRLDSSAPGSALEIGACNGRSTWTLDKGGYLRGGSFGLCVRGNLSDSSATMQTCIDTLYEKWFFTGNVRSSTANLCVNVRDSDADSGAAATLAACNGSSGQRFDYYP